MKSLEQTFIYAHLNKSNGLTQNIAALFQKGQTLTKEQLEDSFMLIMRNFKYPLKYKVMEAYKSGEIILKFGTQDTKLPTCLPFLLTKANGKIVAVIPIDSYGLMDKETGNVKIDAKKLYVLMESAYLAIVCYLFQSQLSNRTALISNGSAIYSGMFTKVLNKKYSLNINKTKLHKVLLLSSKFYMINILGMKDSDLVFNYALKNCPNGNLLTLQETNDMLELEDYDNLEKFLKALTKPELGLNFKDLTVRGYLEAFINMYDASCLLSLESFPYFLFNVMSVTDGAYLNNQYILEDIVNNYGAKMYTDLCSVNK